MKFVVESIFKKDKIDINFCNFNLTKDSYSKFYKIIIERENNTLDFSIIKNYLSIVSKITNAYEKINELQLNNKELEKKKNLLNEEIIKLKKNNEKNVNEFISNIKCYEEYIIRNPFFLIPMNVNIKKEKIGNNWVNTCKVCKYNCHLNCTDLCQQLCKCMSWQLKCKNCPNKCNTDSHEFIKYKYENCSYKSIDVLIKEYLNINKRIIPYKSKVNYFIENYKKKQQNEIQKQVDNIQKQIEEIDSEMKINSEKAKESNDNYNKLKEEIQIFSNKETENINLYESFLMEIISSKIKFEKV